jgi:flagellar biosynthesis/type III secretory pathway M-ring protein FliF/YscJ
VLATEFNLKYLEEEKRLYALAQRRQMLENLFKILVVLATGITLAFALYNLLKPKKEEEIPIIEVEEVQEEVSEEDQLYGEMLEAIRNLIEADPEKALEILRIWISGSFKWLKKKRD